jgi:CYTH domain-containing protein
VDLVEIERKYLVNYLPFELSQYKCHNIRQGYISFNPEIRIRNIDDKFFLTLKSDGNIARKEYEMEITESNYVQMKDFLISNLIEKTRYIIPISDRLNAELDVYIGKLNGGKVVEVEFSSETEAWAFKEPNWFGKEITMEKQFKNKNLSIYDRWPIII